MKPFLAACLLLVGMIYGIVTGHRAGAAADAERRTAARASAAPVGTRPAAGGSSPAVQPTRRLLATGRLLDAAGAPAGGREIFVLAAPGGKAATGHPGSGGSADGAPGIRPQEHTPRPPRSAPDPPDESLRRVEIAHARSAADGTFGVGVGDVTTLRRYIADDGLVHLLLDASGDDDFVVQPFRVRFTDPDGPAVVFPDAGSESTTPPELSLRLARLP